MLLSAELNYLFSPNIIKGFNSLWNHRRYDYETIPHYSVAVSMVKIPANRKITLILKIGGSQFFFFLSLSYLPTTPLGQDMTQGQFLSGV